MREKALLITLLLSCCAFGQKNITHKVRLPSDFTAPSSLKDGKITRLTKNDSVELIGKCKKGCDFNIIKLEKYKDEAFSITQVRSFDKEVVLEILLDKNDVYNLTTQQNYLLSDTLDTNNYKNIDFVIPVGKRIELLSKGSKYSRISVFKDKSCFVGFVESEAIKDVKFNNKSKTISVDCRDNSLVRKEMYDDFVEGTYKAVVHYGNQVKQETQFDVKYDQNLLKVRGIIFNEFYNEKKTDNSSKYDSFISILIYDRKDKTLKYNDFVYQFGVVNDRETRDGLKYKIVKVK
ncbi:hypothetical protein JI750_15025 [Flavobacterium sp. GN10]|uniref:SH3 domain-containing protein n=1 Tax=Flavobacterium tagetis TaxID=2801336 RepID=A0ABS1KFM3_9FLAO|nr:hypothetical protein [Flavobacterium tagetis]MBL0738210.1 hypothetical protein [Flavobacterium tagetis]